MLSFNPAAAAAFVPMTHRLTALALLLLSGLILLAGPYPCRAQAAAPEAEAPCHEEHAAGGPALASGDAAPPDDCCADGSDALCEHACQGTAVLALAPDLSVAELAAAARPLESGHLLAPLPHGLDHVPLA